MYIYMKAQFQIFQHKLIKYTDTWGTAFSDNLIKIRQTNKQTGKHVWVLEITVTAIVS